MMANFLRISESKPVTVSQNPEQFDHSYQPSINVMVEVRQAVAPCKLLALKLSLVGQAADPKIVGKKAKQMLKINLKAYQLPSYLSESGVLSKIRTTFLNSGNIKQ